MTIPTNLDLEQVKGWQTHYSTTEAHWKDLQKLGWLFMPFVIGVFIASMFVVLIMTFVFWDWFVQRIHTPWDLTRWSAIVYGSFFLPLALAVIGFAILMRRGRSFFEAFYKVDEEFDTKGVIRRRFFGIPPLPPSPVSGLEYPYVIIPENGQIKPEHKWVKWLGGPANLVILDGVAVYLERGNKFSRVVGSGLVYLENYETVRAVVQLSPQKKEVDLKASTKEGIPISMKARIVFQVGVNPVEHVTPDNRMYPFDPQAVKKAVERTTLRYTDDKQYEKSYWYDSVWGQVNGPLSKYISSHSLNDFFVTDTDRENTLPDLVHKRLFDEVQPKLAEQGIRLLELQITELKPPEEVDKQRLENWEAIRTSISTIKKGASKAFEIRQTETARAIAQRDLILAIAEGLDKMDQEHLDEPLLLSLSAILDQSLSDSYTRSLIASDALETLENLKKLL